MMPGKDETRKGSDRVDEKLRMLVLPDDLNKSHSIYKLGHN
jgi:hypothetical protein